MLLPQPDTGSLVELLGTACIATRSYTLSIWGSHFLMFTLYMYSMTKGGKKNPNKKSLVHCYLLAWFSKTFITYIPTVFQEISECWALPKSRWKEECTFLAHTKSLTCSKYFNNDIKTGTNLKRFWETLSATEHVKVPCECFTENSSQGKRGDLSAVHCQKATTQTIIAWGCQLNKKHLILQHQTAQMHKG